MLDRISIAKTHYTEIGRWIDVIFVADLYLLQNERDCSRAKLQLADLNAYFSRNTKKVCISWLLVVETV